MTSSIQDDLASLVAAETARPEPSAARADSVWEGVQARLGGDAPPASVPANSGPGILVVSAIALGVFSAGALGWSLLSTPTPAFEPLPTPPPLAVAATRIPAPELHAELAIAGGDVDPEVSKPTAGAKAVSKTPRVRKNVGTVADELALIERARAALSGGRASAALSALKEHSRGFPQGDFLEEAAALRVSALCKSGKADAAAKAAARFKSRWPRSVHAQRVADCGA